MKITRIVSYLHKTKKTVRNFVWIESTHLGNPPIETCIEVEEIPSEVIKEVELDGRIRLSVPMNSDGEKDLHDTFLSGEFRSGHWEALDKPRPVVPDIPLPDPSEFRAPRANRGLLDSASSRFRKPPS